MRSQADGIIQVKHLYSNDIIKGDAVSPSPYPILWIDSDTVEYSEAPTRRVHWNVSQMPRIIATVPQVSASSDVPSNQAVIAVAPEAGEGHWALVLDPPAAPASTTEGHTQFLYHVQNHQYTKLDTPPHCRLHATLMAFQESVHLVTMNYSSNGNDMYQVRPKMLSSYAHSANTVSYRLQSKGLARFPPFFRHPSLVH